MKEGSVNKYNLIKKTHVGTRESGQIMVLLGLLLPMLLAFLAMGVDLGQGYLLRRANQNGADAAAVIGERAMLKGGV
jgi:uncharacterized membrane protein